MLPPTESVTPTHEHEVFFVRSAEEKKREIDLFLGCFVGDLSAVSPGSARSLAPIPLIMPAPSPLFQKKSTAALSSDSESDEEEEEGSNGDEASEAEDEVAPKAERKGARGRKNAAVAAVEEAEDEEEEEATFGSEEDIFETKPSKAAKKKSRATKENRTAVGKSPTLGATAAATAAAPRGSRRSRNANPLSPKN